MILKVEELEIGLIKVGLLIVVLLVFPFWGYAQCNGSNFLCNKKYNEIAYLTTHNSFSSKEGGFSFPNQNYNISSQLDAGIRGLMIDVYDEGGIPTVYHGFSFLGSVSLSKVFNEVKSFLDSNPNEVLTIIFESYVPVAAIDTTLSHAGLSDYLYVHTASDSWPTLQTMINDNQRLVVFSDKNDAGPEQQWYHYIWDYAVETHFKTNSKNTFNCSFNRGSSDNDLFILNHFITEATYGYGLEDSAKVANANPYFHNRVLQCQLETGKFPNFITVDFYDIGDCMEVVNNLNGVVTQINNSEYPYLKVYPTATTDIIFIEGDQGRLREIELLNLMGQNLNFQIVMEFISNILIRIDLKKLTTGTYILKTNNGFKKILKY